MANDKSKISKADAVELEETELDDISGGPNRRAHDHIGNFNFKVEVSGASEALKTPDGMRASGDVIIKGKKILQN